jgi:hypothetical protein
MIVSSFAIRGVGQMQAPDSAQERRLQTVIEELSRLTRPSGMPRRIELLDSLLAGIAREDAPELWAALRVELANSLYQYPLGDRAENLEAAIGHYQSALEVYTRAAFPDQRAATQNNLANAYRGRIRGERAKICG